ncbi:MAG: hypothetical protein JST54_14915 [Deltaproteobacteria bacterium]|nr:hypothetical protein [Deltaproteobacteria bacterium]
MRLAALAFVLALPGSAFAVTGPEAVQRAQDWVNAQMPYCQVPYGGCDSHVCCGAGYRPENPDWDPYRSDCSGMVSYCWDIGGPGRVTTQFAPFVTDISYVIDATELQPGDALNSDEHIMLFAGWADYLNVAVLIDESDWGYPAQQRNLTVYVSGSTVTRADWPSNPFQAIRYANIQPACTPSCNGSVLTGADCGQGDCGAYGSSCVDDSLGARCVFYACPAQGSATVCMPDGHTIGTCQDGAISTGDCAAYGSTCVDDSLGARCVFSACPAQGTTQICMPDGHTIGTCTNGGITTGDCAAYGASCIDDSLGARCAYPDICPNQGDALVCLPDGHTLGNCHDGVPTLTNCSTNGQICQVDGTTASCVDPNATTSTSTSTSSSTSASSSTSTTGTTGEESTTGSTSTGSSSSGSSSSTTTGGTSLNPEPKPSSKPQDPEVEGGCGASGGGASLFALLALFGLRRRR